MLMFIYRPFEIWPVLGTIHLERVYAIITIVYWVLFYSKKTWVNNRLTYAFFFFWVVLLLSWLSSQFPEGGQRVAEEYFKYVVFFMLIMASVRDEKDLKVLTLGYLLVVGLYMTHSLREFLCGRHVHRMGITRMIGIDQTFNDPNTFAATILYSLPLSLAFWPEAKKPKHKLCLAYYTALSAACVVFTGSRSGFAVLLVFVTLALPRLFWDKRLLILAIVVFPLAWFVIPEKLQNRFETMIDPSKGPNNAQGSAEGRTQGFLDGINNWQRSPVFGVGPGAHGPAAGHGAQPHNLYGQVLGEMGTAGGLALLAILSCFATNALEVRRLSRLDQTGLGPFPTNLSRAIGITVVLLLVKGWADHNLYRYTWLWFGAFQAIAVNCMRERLAEVRYTQVATANDTA
jgi:O-antigen ligase